MFLSYVVIFYTKESKFEIPKNSRWLAILCEQFTKELCAGPLCLNFDVRIRVKKMEKIIIFTSKRFHL